MKIYQKDFLAIIRYLTLQKKEDSKFYPLFLSKIPSFSEPKEITLGNLRHVSLAPIDMDIFETVTAEELKENERFFKAVIHLFCQNKSLKELEILALLIAEAKCLQPDLRELIQRDLRFFINVEKYGYKAAHLIETVELLKNMPLFPIPVSIPDFLPISQQEIRAHIDSYFHAESLPSLQETWERFCFAQGENDRQLTPDAKKVLAVLRKNIARALKSFSSDELREFLKRYPSVPMMVRSSSNEDSEDLDNAGGNESECNVPSEYEAILQGMAEVIPSYLSEKSLEQRLLAGDNILQIPTLATFVQCMIGADDLPERFCAGIGYREEPLARTAGTSAVHVAPGHGELLVNSEGAADDFYVGEHEQIEAIIHDKTHRKAPDAAGGLVLKSNPAHIRRQPALADDYVITLHRLMGELQKIQGSAIDIEFVVDKEEKMIYLVQRRPLIFDTSSLQPQYVEIDSGLSDTVIQGRLVISADLKARTIQHPEEVLLAQNIGVFRRYRQMKAEERKKIKCVILQEEALRMSHEGNQFRRLNIPVVSLIDKSAYQKIERRIEQEQPLCVETSSGRVFLTDEVVIKEGMIDSPIPLERSLREVSFSAEPPSTARASRTVKELLHILKISDSNAEKQQAIKELTSLLVSYFHHTLKQGLSKESEALCQRLARNIFAELPNVERGLTHPVGSAERAFPIRFLEALLFQPLRSEIVDGESVKTLGEEKRAEAAILKKYGPPGLSEELLPFYFQYMKLAGVSVRKDLDREWNEFLIAILKDPSANAGLAPILCDFQAMGLGAYWLNVCFYSAHKKAKGDPQQCLELLMKGYQEVANELQWLKVVEDLITDAERQTPLYGQPEAFKQACLSSWTKLFNSSCALIQFIEKRKLFTINPEPALISNRAFDLLERTVEVLDQNIKTLTGTPEEQYPDSSLKVENFDLLLTDLLNLLMRLAKPIPLDIVAMIQGQREENASKSFLIERVKWLQANHRRLKEDLSLKQLEMTPDFDVQLLRFPAPETFRNKSRVNYHAHPPKTFEEELATVHGHLKDLIRAWRNKVTSMDCSFDAKDLDRRLAGLQALQGLWRNIPCPSSHSGARTSIGETISIVRRHIKQSCILPGEAHEGKFVTTSDVVTGDTTLYLKMLGDNRYGRAGSWRWRNVIFYALLGGKILDLAYEEEPYLRRHGDEFCDVTLTAKYNPLKLSAEGKIEEFGAYFKEIFSLMMAATMSDVAIGDSRFAKFSFKDNNSVQQIIANLKVFAGERVDQVVDELEEDFFRAYPYYNHQFCEYYECKMPAKALKIAFLTLQKGAFEGRERCIQVLVRGLEYSEKGIRSQAYAHIAELLSDPRFIYSNPVFANQLADAVVKCPEFTAQGQEVLLSVIERELSSGNLTKVVGMFLSTLKSCGASNSSTEACIERFLCGGEQLLITPFEAFSLMQYYPAPARMSQDWLKEMLVKLPEEQLPKEKQERQQLLRDLMSLAILREDLISEETAIAFLDHLRSQDGPMARSDEHIASKYFDFLHKSFLEKKNAAGLQALLARTSNDSKRADLLHQIHAIDPSFAMEVFDEWVKKENNVDSPLFFYEHYLLRKHSPFHLPFSKWLLQSTDRKREFRRHLDTFFKFLQKKKRSDDFLNLVDLCFAHGIEKSFLLEKMNEFCRKCLPNDLAMWRRGIDLLCTHVPEEQTLRALLLPEIMASEGNAVLLERLKAVIAQSGRLPDALTMAAALAEPLIDQDRLALIDEFLDAKEGGFTDLLRKECLSLQSFYQRYHALVEGFNCGEKGADDIVRFCDEFWETKPFPVGLYFRSCLLLTEKSEDFSSLQSLLTRLSFDDPWQIEVLKKIGMAIKERKERERIPLAIEILTLLSKKEVEADWLRAFASSLEKTSSAMTCYKDKEWHLALTKHLSKISVKELYYL